ncbi:type II secretion system protein GspC [Alishewanella sp. SMS8]|uniref:type II secretion system protein GspC n=1 Tax=Alishewanella sp. SMS8 TaxID=2994676 RepID=UPI00274085BE|nr:type II secretion system protein GspC [Alishewanella sp. SMS8]MDP5206776.1 type II secretion system protein GspC [Alishewanella sp. SMS9]MDP5460538.1 type II secretion system protein GspC [Alishewanella sp. SMS8]
MSLLQLPTQLKKLPLRPFRSALNLLLLLILAWLLAKLSWQLLPSPTSPALMVSSSASIGNVNHEVPQDLNNLTRYALFGEAAPETAAPVAVVTEAPKTQLNAKLTGLVAVPAKPEAGSAIIEQRGTEVTYAVGDNLEGTRAKLHQVLDDRVLLEINGRYETLMLDGVEFTRIAQANAGLGREDNADAYAVEEPIVLAQPIATGFNTPEVQARRDEIMAEPMKFFDYVRVTPVQRDGQLAGYRLMPGKDIAIFQQLGFLEGDLAIEINGVALNDMQQALRVINDIRDATEASVKVERDGEIRDILFSLSQ